MLTKRYLAEKRQEQYRIQRLISSFMSQLGNGKCVVLVISDEYLKSENCMFELLEVVSHGDFYNRVFPIILESARFYRPIDRIEYIRYWETMADDLNASMSTMASQANLQGIRESLDSKTLYRASIAELTLLLSDMNNFSVDTHLSNSFKDISELVESVFPKIDHETNYESLPYFILANYYDGYSVDADSVPVILEVLLAPN